MTTGILEDSSGCIDFVCWNETTMKLDEILNIGETFRIKNVKIVS